MSNPCLVSYIDPMSGAILVQVIAAGAIGCIAFFRQSIWRITRFVFRAKRSSNDSAK